MTQTAPLLPTWAEPRQLQFSDGEALSLPLDTAWRLVKGEVLVSCAGRPVELGRAPHILDAAGSVRGERSASFFALGPVTVQGEPLDTLPTERLARLLADESAQLWRRIDADARRDDDSFLSWAAPVPGPWYFRRAEAQMYVVQGDEARIRACLPRGVRPLPGTHGRYVLGVTRFEGVGSLDVRDPSQFSYHEVTPFLPVWSGWRGPAAFVPELYPDAWMAVLLGREIHGFPKRTARIGFHEDGAELIVDRRLALRVRFEPGEDVQPNEALSGLAQCLLQKPVAGRATRRLLDLLSDDIDRRFSVLVHKRIGSPQTAGQTLALDELVRVPVLLDPVRDAQRLEDVRLDLPGGPGILHGQVIAGWRMHTGFRFGRGAIERRGAGRT